MIVEHTLRRAFVAPLSGFGYNDVSSAQHLNVSHQGTELIDAYRRWHQTVFPSAHRMEWDKVWENELHQRKFLNVKVNVSFRRI